MALCRSARSIEQYAISHLERSARTAIALRSPLRKTILACTQDGLPEDSPFLPIRSRSDEQQRWVLARRQRRRLADGAPPVTRRSLLPDSDARCGQASDSDSQITFEFVLSKFICIKLLIPIDCSLVWNDSMT